MDDFNWAILGHLRCSSEITLLFPKACEDTHYQQKQSEKVLFSLLPFKRIHALLYYLANCNWLFHFITPNMWSYLVCEGAGKKERGA